MNSRPLSTFSIVLKNIFKKRGRSLIMLIVMAVLSFTVFGGWIIASSIENGIDSASSRLGADIMIVPVGAEDSIEGALLTGDPSTFYLDYTTISAEIADVDGIEIVSPQLYIATLSASCCSFPVQLIGIDLDTDFVVGSWISSAADGDLEDGELIIGYSVGATPGGTIKFYNRELDCISRLDETGMGYDESVFMNMDTARMLMAETDAAEEADIDVEDMASVVMIQVEDGADVSEVQESIENVVDTDEVTVLTSDTVIQGVSDTLDSLDQYIYVLLLILWILVAFVTNLLFVLNLNERKKEFAILKVIGAKRKKIVMLILIEALLIAIIGAVFGLIISSVIIFPFSLTISNSIGLPYLIPTVVQIVTMALISLLISIVAGSIAAVFTAMRISKAQTYVTIKENE